jgi:hypothetical protein
VVKRGASRRYLLPFQQFAFEQPNTAMLYAPYNLLPGIIVPVVMFSQLAAIRKLMATSPWRHGEHGS